MHLLSETLKSLGDWFGSRLDQLFSLLCIDLRRRSITYDLNAGRVRITDFGLKIGDRKASSHTDNQRPENPPLQANQGKN